MQGGGRFDHSDRGGAGSIDVGVVSCFRVVRRPLPLVYGAISGGSVDQTGARIVHYLQSGEGTELVASFPVSILVWK